MGDFSDSTKKLREEHKANKLKLKNKYAMYMQSVDDSFSTKEVLERIYQQGVCDFYIFTPDCKWGGDPLPASSVRRLKETIDDLLSRFDDLKINHKIVNYEDFKSEKPSETETKIRNFSLNFVRKQGFNHVLIVDDDELWIKNFLVNVLDKEVTKSKPTALAYKCISVFGYPGYPIYDGADRITMYIGSGNFRFIRCPEKKYNEYDNLGMIHLSMVRESKESLLKKLKSSAHWYDSEFDYQNVCNVLMENLQIGLSNLHPWKLNPNTWPTLSKWRNKNDYYQIPASIRKHIINDVGNSKKNEIIFSLCYTSRRYYSIYPVIKKWLDNASDKSSIEVVVSVDADDSLSLEVIRSLPDDIKRVIQCDKPFNCVRGWNYAAIASTGKVIIAISDDILPPKDWDQLLLKKITPKNWIEKEAVVLVDDKYQGESGDICTLPIITRKRYEKLGYIFYPKYESMFCDDDLTEHSKKDKILIKATKLQFEHIHSTCNKRGFDSVDSVHSGKKRWNYGKEIFNYRKTMGFPIDDGKNVENPINYDFLNKSVLSRDYGAYFQVCKNGFCLYEAIERLYYEGVLKFFLCIPNRHWNGKETPAEDIAEIKKIAEKARKIDSELKIFVKIFNIDDAINSEKSYTKIEAIFRNRSLNWIRNDYYVDDILVFDDDELVMKGFIEKLDNIVSTSNPTSIKILNVPVVGIPGLPIKDAKDNFNVYMGHNSYFIDSRESNCNTTVPIVGMFHFTLVRKTYKEIEEKINSSSHYDDPDYGFSGWLENTFSRIHVGLKNVHMYKKYQIWPEVRKWTKYELSQIPDTIKEYLNTSEVYDE